MPAVRIGSLHRDGEGEAAMPDKLKSAAVRGFPSYGVAGREGQIETHRDGSMFVIQQDGDTLLRISARLASSSPPTLIADAVDGARPTALRSVLAGLEAIVAAHPQVHCVRLEGAGWSSITPCLLDHGVAIVDERGSLVVLPDLLWQTAALWLPEHNAPSYPQTHVLTAGKRHPRRRPKPVGEVYGRFIPWLNQTISFRAATMEQDLPLVHRWMNDPRVAAFWKEGGDMEKHRRYLGDLLADPHMLPLIGSFDGTPFSYFEIYWAKENRLAPFYDADDYDRGWHVVIGEDAYRGRQWITAWLPSLMHYLFLDDCRTQRIVGEPQADHHQQIRNLEKAGFAKVKHFDFPHKRALLVMLLRERFFGDRLWVPQDQAEPLALKEEHAAVLANGQLPSPAASTPVL